MSLSLCGNTSSKVIFSAFSGASTIMYFSFQVFISLPLRSMPMSWLKKPSLAYLFPGSRASTQGVPAGASSAPSSFRALPALGIHLILTTASLAAVRLAPSLDLGKLPRYQ